jgi:SAM-dependent methyltransferase
VNGPGINWSALARLRAAFLDGSAGAADYWQSESDLRSYDATFAQRIGWKWDYVLAELQRRGWSPPAGELLDWGCGSGIAHRAFLDHFGADSVTRLNLWDRSTPALDYAQGRARAKFPGLPVHRGIPGAQAILLVSHVLTELAPVALDELLGLVARATCLLWIEPGTHAVSRALIAVRERLLGTMRVVAPCTHAAPCGLLAAGNERHWCHHFASPPPAVFTDPDWGRFARLTGIDLRSVPLSFLVMDRRSPPPLSEGAVRVLGRPRVYKAHALLLGCRAEGVTEGKLSQRDDPDQYRQLKKGVCASLQVWDAAGGDIVQARPALPGSKAD